MEEKNYTGIIPENHTGKIIDTVQSVEFPSAEEARSFFQVARQRLLDVNSWHEITGVFTADFQLIDAEGNEVQRPVSKGDYFKISIPGPGSVAGEGFDWVAVEEVSEVSEGDVESIGVRVRPASNPLNNDEKIAHFYSEESTSNFIVTREGAIITAGIYDRNTKPNQQESDLITKARDLVVGSGAVAFASKLQWERLAQALLKRE